MKKLLYLLALLLPLAGFTQNARAFYGSSISRSYGVDTLAGFKAVNTNTLGYAGLVAISAADTSAFFTNGTGHASIYNSAGVLRQPQYVGVGGSPDVSGTAYLSLTGTAGGFLTARMTAAQKSAIVSPATGLLIYQTDGTAGFYYYNGSAWGAVGGGSGITIGTTAITGGGTGYILFQKSDATVTQNTLRYLDGPDSPYYLYTGATLYVGGYAAGCCGGYTGFQIYSQGSPVLMTNSTQVILGIGAGHGITEYGANRMTAIGYTALATHEAATALGANTTAGNNATAVGAYSSATYTSSMALGKSATTTATNQLVFGAAAAAGGLGVYDNVYFNGSSSTTPAPTVLRTCDESGTNQTSTANLTLQPSLGTGSGTGGSFIVKIGVAGSSGTTQNTATEKFRVNNLGIKAVISAYDDDTAAGVAGLTAGQFYQTTGAAAAPLNVAGILMIKQ